MYATRKSIFGHNGYYRLKNAVKFEDGGFGSFRRLKDQELEQLDTTKSNHQQSGPAKFNRLTSSCSLSSFEQAQIGSVYSSLRTEVYICLTTATLKVQDTKADDGFWNTQAWGVPVLVLEKNNHPDANIVTLHLAELGTGMSLWKDTISAESQYQVGNSLFHHLSVSWNHNIQAGLQFTNPGAAYEFWVHASDFISSPQNHAESVLPKLKRLFRSPKLPRNSRHISVQSGSLQHITHVDVHDRFIYSSMQCLLGSISEL